MPSDWIVDGPADARVTVVLAHGAGAAMDTPFMAAIAGGLGAAGFRALRFEFDYMSRSRHEGRRRPPPGAAALCRQWREVVAGVQARWQGPVIIGGKSLGGRMASLVADELRADGLFVLGYPFHPPGKPDKPRVEHLAALATPTLILQGERDPFGTPDEVAGYDLAGTIELVWLPDGDHGFKPRKRSGYTEAGNWQQAVERATAFVEQAAARSV
jgi:predicted alpha/beta-hydrolase family hydrolase